MYIIPLHSIGLDTMLALFHVDSFRNNEDKLIQQILNYMCKYTCFHISDNFCFDDVLEVLDL